MTEGPNRVSRAESGRINRGFIHQKDRDVIPHRIHPPALAALQALLIALNNQRLLADWANQDIEKVLGNHADILRQFDVHYRDTEHKNRTRQNPCPSARTRGSLCP